MTRIQANLVLLLAGAIWGMGFVAQSTAMDEIGPFTFIGLRFVMAAVAMLPWAMFEARRAPAALQPRDWLGFVGIGSVLFVGIVAQQYGLLTTTVTNSGFLTGLYVVMTPFFAVLIYRQWPHPVVWPAAALALAGIWFLSDGRLAAMTTGDWFTVFCAATWALQVLLIARNASRTGRPVTLSVVQFALCAVLGLAGAVAFEGIETDAAWRAMPEIVYAGVFSGGLAFTLQAVGQRYTTAPQAAIFLSSEAVFAAIFGAIILGERLPASGFLGCALILAAILAVEIVPALNARRAISANEREAAARK